MCIFIVIFLCLFICFGLASIILFINGKKNYMFIYIIISIISGLTGQVATLIRSRCSYLLQSAEATRFLTAISLVNLFYSTFLKQPNPSICPYFCCQPTCNPTLPNASPYATLVFTCVNLCNIMFIPHHGSARLVRCYWAPWVSFTMTHREEEAALPFEAS